MSNVNVRWRKRPVVIEAFQYDINTAPEAAPDWFWNAMSDQTIRRIAGMGEHLLIETLEGVMRAKRGDWIIRGIKGEIYACKPEIFAATYEPAGDK